MADDPELEVPEGAAVFPLIPEELGVDPLLLAVMHAIVFVSGSSDDVIHPAAAQEALEFIATYLQRLTGAQVQRVRENVACLTAFAKQEQWPKHLVHAFQSLLTDLGVEGEGKA